ncbi:MAG: hypothetical protein WCJ35_21080 [Planctomycetota bacterium]
MTTTVHVLAYCHRHGETVSVYSSEEKAQKAAALCGTEEHLTLCESLQGMLF